MLTTVNGRYKWTPDPPHVSERDPDGNVIAVTDWLGGTFRIGDQVAYCIGAGRGQVMAIGKVLQIKCEVRERTDYRPPNPGEQPNYTYPLSDRTAVRYRTLYDVITVQVLTLKTSARYSHGKRTRPAWVNPQNITALPMQRLNDQTSSD